MTCSNNNHIILNIKHEKYINNLQQLHLSLTNRNKCVQNAIMQSYGIIFLNYFLIIYFNYIYFYNIHLQVSKKGTQLAITE